MTSKKLLKNIPAYLVLISILAIPFQVFSVELDSANYKIVGANTDGGGIVESDNYTALLTTGTISNDPRNYSTSYMMYNDPQHAFVANVPEVACFETDTDGYSNCTTGPAELTTGGMVAICGTGGCYNRARFEILENGNPTDTVYSIQVSRDNFTSDISYVDGSTYRLESISTHNINDFMTKSSWEAETFNIQGLSASTTYYVRIVALHGTFTQSDPSPVGTATTAAGLLYFDIDIADEFGTSAETSEPHTISFTGQDALVGGSAAITATNRIWLDAESNSEGGFAIVVRGANGGLHSSTTSQTITSATANLDTTSSGFGLQSDYINFDTNSLLGSITAVEPYTGNLNSVGGVTTTAAKIYEADGPISNGRMSIKLIAKPGTDKTPANDYQEEVFILFVPRY